MFETIHTVGMAEKKGFTTGETLVLLVLASMANDEGICFPSRKKLAQYTGLEARSVSRVITKLESKGIVSKEDRFRENKSRTSNVYKINLSALTQAGGVDPQVQGGETQESRGPGLGSPPHKAKGKTSSKAKSLSRESRPPSKKEIEKEALKEAQKQAFTEAKEWWMSWYQRTFEADAPFNAKEAGNLKRLLAHFDHEVDLFRDFILAASGLTDRWMLEQLASISTTYSQLGKLQAALHRGVKPTNGSGDAPTPEAPGKALQPSLTAFRDRCTTAGLWDSRYPWVIEPRVPTAQELLDFQAESDLCSDESEMDRVEEVMTLATKP